MRFKKIKVQNFRNLKPMELALSPRVNVFYGENAQGKTNFLESIFALTHGRSFRTSENETLISHVDPEYRFCLVEGEVEKNRLTHVIRLALTDTEKRIWVNEKKASSLQLVRDFSSVLFSPESLSAIKSGDRERRELVDDVILSVFHDKAHLVDEFRKALKQRNKLLKDLKDGVFEVSQKNVLYLETLTETFLKIATELVAARIQALNRMKGLLSEAMSYIFGDKSEEKYVDISVDYLISNVVFKSENPAKIHDAMYKRWQELKVAEIKTGHSLVGPHKHDIRILFDEKDSRFFCSQGQQRLIILAFKMAQIRLHYDVHRIYPILLLDDVLSELDEKRRIKLLAYLDQLNAQIFITTTENEVLDYLDKNMLAVYNVAGGVIERNDSIHAGDRGQEDMSVR